MDAIDLHVHSTYSDGTLTPGEIIKLAADTGLRALALTDHDTTDGIDEAARAAGINGIELVPGIELSCCYGGFKEVHIVGLYIDKQNDVFKNAISDARNARENRNVKMARLLSDAGMNVTIEDMRLMYKDSVITRAHFADYLLRKGYVKSRREAFDRYLNDNAPCYVPRKHITASDGIELIKTAGGVPILAHPTLYRLGNSEMHKMLADLKQCGLIGIECIYSTYNAGEELQMKQLADEFGLIPSGGSDFHGANKPSINLGTGKGNLFVPYSLLDTIKMYAKTGR